MAKTLIVYGTTEGQTAKIAQHLADVGRRLGHTVDVAHASEIVHDGAFDAYAAVLVGGSLHEGLGAASRNPEEVDDVQHIIDAFARDRSWKPDMTANFAGALKYTQYNWLKRALMKHISKREGGDLDTSHDHEYTNWNQVTQFAERFFALA